MVISYCVKQKKRTECVEPSGYKKAQNGRLTFFLYLCRMWDNKNKVRQKAGKLKEPT